MKYRFERNNKQLSSEEIKSKMDFEKVRQQANASSGGNMSSPELHSKFTLPVSSTVLGTAAAVLVLITAGPALLRSENNPFKFWESAEPEPIAPQEIVIDTAAISPLVEITEDDLIDHEVVVTVEMEEVPEPVDVVIEEEEPEEEEPMQNEDVLIKAYPLPDLDSFLNAIDEELVYPEEARKDNVHGYVRVFFKVNKNGIPEDFRIDKSLGELFDNEAIRVLKKHRNWEPASFNGQTVDSYFTIKVSFEFEKPQLKDTLRYY